MWQKKMDTHRRNKNTEGRSHGRQENIRYATDGGVNFTPEVCETIFLF